MKATNITVYFIIIFLTTTTKSSIPFFLNSLHFPPQKINANLFLFSFFSRELLSKYFPVVGAVFVVIFIISIYLLINFLQKASLG